MAVDLSQQQKKLALAYLDKHPIYALKDNNFKKMLA